MPTLLPMKKLIPLLVLFFIACGHPKYDPDAQRYFDSAHITNDTIKNAINDLVVSLKKDSIWGKSVWIYLGDSFPRLRPADHYDTSDHGFIQAGDLADTPYQGRFTRAHFEGDSITIFYGTRSDSTIWGSGTWVVPTNRSFDFKKHKKKKESPVDSTWCENGLKIERHKDGTWTINSCCGCPIENMPDIIWGPDDDREMHWGEIYLDDNMRSGTLDRNYPIWEDGDTIRSLPDTIYHPKKSFSKQRSDTSLAFEQVFDLMGKILYTRYYPDSITFWRNIQKQK